MTLEYAGPIQPLVCDQCGTQLAPGLLTCPGCDRLIYGQRLSELAQSAQEAEARNDLSNALSYWREAIELLPNDSQQYAVIARRITQLVSAVDTGIGNASSDPDARHGLSSKKGKAAAGLGALGLLLLKFKTLLLLGLSYGKFLVLGLTKGGTFLSMGLTLLIYWKAFGWKFALGLVVTTYFHEMGHVVALRRYGFKANAPMFVPGLGAFILFQQKIVDPHENAVIGLAGPNAGLLASLLALGLWALTRQPVLAAICAVSAWINLFNLMPIWTLDGGRAFHAFTPAQRVIAAATALAMYFLHAPALLVIVGILGVIRVFRPSKTRGDWGSLANYCVLVVALTLLSRAFVLAHIQDPWAAGQ